jgi:hypothetical protein
MTASTQSRMLFRLSLALALLWALPALASDEECLACHGAAGMKSESGKSLQVDAAKHRNSVHGDLGCTTCHAGVNQYPHAKPIGKPTCVTCHDREVAEVPQSVHSILGTQACTSCHGQAHEVQRSEKLVPQQWCRATSSEFMPLPVGRETYKRQPALRAMAAPTKCCRRTTPSPRYITPTFRAPVPPAMHKNS